MGGSGGGCGKGRVSGGGWVESEGEEVDSVEREWWRSDGGMGWRGCWGDEGWCGQCGRNVVEGVAGAEWRGKCGCGSQCGRGVVEYARGVVGM